MLYGKISVSFLFYNNLKDYTDYAMMIFVTFWPIVITVYDPDSVTKLVRCYDDLRHFLANSDHCL
ncbi:hypothetical protein WN48_10874 [Eufriesea mexicana]|uniref:Uncharacterized protein n=1 Tax=Eufriesea mexicana TaxID=516756 RepID=A0A310SUD2_9HYME|nr:hypothetical protein WN48_10874 [Eufriesea mexicana]